MNDIITHIKDFNSNDGVVFPIDTVEEILVKISKIENIDTWVVDEYQLAYVLYKSMIQYDSAVDLVLNEVITYLERILDIELSTLAITEIMSMVVGIISECKYHFYKLMDIGFIDRSGRICLIGMRVNFSH